MCWPTITPFICSNRHCLNLQSNPPTGVRGVKRCRNLLNDNSPACEDWQSYKAEIIEAVRGDRLCNFCWLHNNDWGIPVTRSDNTWRQDPLENRQLQPQRIQTVSPEVQQHQQLGQAQLRPQVPHQQARDVSPQQHRQQGSIPHQHQQTSAAQQQHPQQINGGTQHSYASPQHQYGRP